MTFQQEINSWFAPPQLELSPAPKSGDIAPTINGLQLPLGDSQQVIVSFLRHCGCPFAERDFKRLQKVAEQHPAIRCIAISHSNNLSTRKWLQAIGGHDKVHVIVDDGRTIYAKWGLGVAGWTHMAPGAFWTLYMLARREGIRNRPTESGSRWQTAGNWAVDGSGIVRWGGPATRSDEEVNFEDAVTSLANVRTSKM